MNIRHYILILLLLSVSACIKDPSTQQKAFTFKNESSRDIDLIVYKNQEDYYESKNATYKVSLKAGESKEVEDTNLEEDGDYFIDWYTKDYKYTNWVYRSPNDPTTGDMIYYSTSGQAYTVTDADMSLVLGRNIWLGSNGEYLSIWEPVDALEYRGYMEYGESVWDEVSAEVKDRTRITLSKKFKADIFVDNLYSFKEAKVSYNYQDDILEERSWVNISKDFQMYGNYSPAEKKFVTRITDTAIFSNQLTDYEKGYVLVMVKKYTQ